MGHKATEVVSDQTGGGRDFQDEMPMLYLAHSKEAWEVLSKGILTTHY